MRSIFCLGEGLTRRQCRRAAAGLVLATAIVAGDAMSPALAGDGAVVIIYHRFGENTYPTTNIRLEQFDTHIAELTGPGGYHVLPLEQIIAALRAGRDLPDRAIAITIDDAFLSVYSEAWPRLKRANLPFTVFVATDPVDDGIKGYMSWDQIREMRDAGVTIGAHSASHLHMPATSPDKVRADLEKSIRRFRAELGSVPALFAYPYGETSLATAAIAKEAGFETRFGQQSGAIYSKSDFAYLPRFALNESFGDIGRFRLVANALPLPVSGVTPADPTLSGKTNPPSFGFTLADSLGEAKGLACYAQGQGRVELQRLGPKRIEVRLDQPFPPGRARINCTLRTREGRWRWFGQQFYIPRQ